MFRPASLSTWLIVVALPSALVPASTPGTVDYGLEGSAIDGVQAVGFWPNVEKAPLSAEDLARCTVHLIPSYDLSVEITEACRVWFLPPRLDQWYLVWMEAGAYVSKQEMLLVPAAQGGAAGVGKPVSVVLHPAGSVALASPESHLGPGKTGRLLGSPQGFTRRVELEAGARAVALPVGMAIAAVNDDRAGSHAYLEITRPFEVSAGRTVTYSPMSPEKDWSVLVVQAQAGAFDLDENVTMELRVNEERRIPEFFSGTRSWAIGVWYDLPPGSAEVSLQSKRAYALPRTVMLRGGKIEHELVRLIRLPKAEVHYELPAALEGSMSLAVEEVGGSARALAQRELSEPVGDIVFEDLPLSVVQFSLRAGDWEFTELRDLRDGVDALVVFQPDSLVITGKVLLGDEPVAAEVGFYAERAGRFFDGKTDGETGYRIIMFEETELVRYRRRGASDGEWVMTPIGEVLSRDTEYDITIPANRWNVVVSDAESGEPIPGAAVTYSNKDERGGSQGAKLTTDAKGNVALPPLRYPQLRLKVAAAMYQPVEEEHTVSDDAGERTLEVPLTPAEKAYHFHVTLPDGRPAAGAEVFLMASLETTPVWHAASDAAGDISAPDLPAAWYAVRHASAGFVVSALRPEMKNDEVIPVSLPLLAPPVMALVHDSTGAGVVQARYRIWVDGIPLDFPPRMVLLPNASIVADDAGLVRLEGLPAAPFDILAWRPNVELERRVRQGELDYRQTTVAYPWPSLIDVDVVE